MPYLHIVSRGDILCLSTAGTFPKMFCGHFSPRSCIRKYVISQLSHPDIPLHICLFPKTVRVIPLPGLFSFPSHPLVFLPIDFKPKTIIKMLKMLHFLPTLLAPILPGTWRRPPSLIILSTRCHLWSLQQLSPAWENHKPCQLWPSFISLSQVSYIHLCLVNLPLSSLGFPFLLTATS